MPTKNTSKKRRASPKRKSASKTRVVKRKSASKKRASPKRKSTSKTTKRASPKFTDKQKKCRAQKIGITMYEFKKHILRSRDNKVVKNPKQAIAIALSQANRLC
jgi:hypothetical protein